MGQPVGGRPFEGPDRASMEQLQKRAEAASEPGLTLSIQGMSCMGCAWLVEQVSGHPRGVLFAKVALDSSLLSLRWERDAFDLCELAEDLQRFGYRITDDVASAGYTPSPLITRLGLTSVFSLNGLLVSAVSGLGVGGEGLRHFYNVLSVVCLFFALFVGGTLFLKPAWGALRFHRWHSDAAPALLLLALFALALGSQFSSDPWSVPTFLFFALLPVLVLARWLAERWKLKIPRG